MTIYNEKIKYDANIMNEIESNFNISKACIEFVIFKTTKSRQMRLFVFVNILINILNYKTDNSIIREIDLYECLRSRYKCLNYDTKFKNFDDLATHKK